MKTECGLAFSTKRPEVIQLMRFPDLDNRQHVFGLGVGVGLISSILHSDVKLQVRCDVYHRIPT